MKAQGWVLAAALLLWGWQGSALWLAAPFAAAVLAPEWVRHRVALGSAEFNRSVEICWVLAVGGLLLVYSRLSVGNVLREFVQWLPAVTFPALLSQVWSESGRLPTASLIPLPRWRRLAHEHPSVDARPAFVAVCLLSASAAGPSRVGFFAGAAVVLGLHLWFSRRGAGRPVWLPVSFAAAVAAGWGISLGLAQIQPWIENRVLEWTSRFDRDRGTGRITRTAIGRQGSVRLSNRVVLRVRDLGPRPMPVRLRVGGFSQWREGSWLAPLATYEKLESAGDEWVLDGRPGLSGAAEVEWVRSSTSGLLPLPGTARVLRDFPADAVERTRLGSVRVEAKSGVVGYRAELGADAAWEGEPTPEDTDAVPTAERAALEAVVSELALQGLGVDEALGILSRYFERHFAYTLDLEDPPAADPRATTPTGRFLLGHRRGHCEYFATAAVLLLRTAGIPARYVTGYMMSPLDREAGAYLVRESNAHAWVRVWRAGVWTDFDPTPAAGLGDEEAAASKGWWGRVTLRLQELRFAVVRWWWLGEKRLLRQAYWLALPLLAGLVWRFRGVRRRADSTLDRNGERRWPGQDSEWLAGVSLMEQAGWARAPSEPRRRWHRRLLDSGCPEGVLQSLATAQDLHDRYRFDPRGLPDSEREQLRLSSGLAVDALRRIHGRTPVRR